MKPKRMNPQLEALRIEHHLRPRPRDRSRSTVSRLLVFLCVPAGLAICGWVAGGGWNQSASAMPPANQSPAVHDAKHGLMAGGKIVSDHTVMVATKVSVARSQTFNVPFPSPETTRLASELRAIE